MIKKILKSSLLNFYKKKGLQIGENSVIIGKPNFGSEPFLISIGNNVTVSANVNFVTHDGATRVFRNLPKYKQVIKYGRITIKDNCFIGINTTILPGITIGPNSIVAAGSIVTKNIPPNTVFGGNPARFLTSTYDYAEKCLELVPEYNEKKYKENKKEELINMFPYPWEIK